MVLQSLFIFFGNWYQAKLANYIVECNWELENKIGNFISTKVRVFMMSELKSFIQNFDSVSSFNWQ